MEGEERNGSLKQSTSSSFMLSKYIPMQIDMRLGYKQLTLAEMKVSKLIERKKAAERDMVQLLSQLCKANDEAKGLVLKIEEANAREMAHKQKLMMTSHTSEDEIYHQFTEILRELDDAQQLKCRLKLDIASAIYEKAKALIEIDFSSAERDSFTAFSEELTREIEETNIEQEFIDSARIEAERELKHIQVQREIEAAKFIKSMEETKSRICNLREEINLAKKLQVKLVITVFDVHALQHELELIRETEKSLHKSRTEMENEHIEQGMSNSALQSSNLELEASKRKLSSLKEDGFKAMNEMDVTRKELMQIASTKEESNRAKKKHIFKLENLNTKLHKAMSKMESASVAEKRADEIVTTLSTALQQIKSDVGAAKREAELITQETKAVTSETETSKLHTKSVKQRLQEAMAELKAVKASEESALEELKAITEITMSERAISALWSSTITISKFEYNYLIKQAKAAQEVADKKVAAAQAWMQALKAENKKKSMRTEADGCALVAVEGKGASKLNEAAFGSEKAVKNEADQFDKEQDQCVKSHNMKLAIAMPSRSLVASGVTGASRRITSVRRSWNSLRRPSFTATPPPSVASKKTGETLLSKLKFFKRRPCRYQKRLWCAMTSHISAGA